MKKCLIIVDVQNDFVDGSLGTKEAQAMLPHLIEKLTALTDTDLFFTLDTHGPDYLDTQEGKHLPVPHCIKPEKGWEIVPQLLPFTKKAKALIEKPTFGSTALPAYVAEYDEIELVGLCTDICVVSNALLLKAFFPEKTIRVDASCCAGVTPASHQSALMTMQSCQIEIENF